MSDGALFGDVGAGHVRLNFATPRKLLEEILERLANSLK
jgi:cystathionine beta-lyase